MKDEKVIVETVNSNGELTKPEKAVMTTTPITIDNQDQLKEVEDLAANLDEMKASVSLAPKYFKFEKPGESLKGVFVGFKWIDVTSDEDGSKKSLKTVGLLLRDKSVVINGGSALVRLFEENAIAQKTPVEVTYLGEEKTKVGKVKLYDLRKLV